MKKEIILKGKGFILRPYRKGDEFGLAKNANNKKIAKNLLEGFPNPYTLNEARKWVKMVLIKYEKGPIINFVIDVDGDMVGSIGGYIVDKRPFTISFGYWLGEDYWGRGIMSEAVKLYTNYVFKNFKNISRIQSETFPWNKASQKVLKRNGFKLEGISRKSYLKDGKIIDDYKFAKLRNNG